MKFNILDDQKIPDELICSICLEALWTPVEHKSCHQMFCKDCLEPCANCPLCRDPLNVDTVCPITVGYIMNILYEIKVKCVDCEVIMTRKDMIGHECRKKCPMDCGQFIFSNEVEKHKTECINRMTICRATDYGCSWSGKFNQQVVHQEDCKYVKAMPIVDDYLANKLSQLEIDTSEYNATKYRLDEVMSQLDEMKKQWNFQVSCSDKLYIQLLIKDGDINLLTEELTRERERSGELAEECKSRLKDSEQILYETQVALLSKEKKIQILLNDISELEKQIKEDNSSDKINNLEGFFMIRIMLENLLMK